jgi:hypothetical protein
MSPKEFSAVFLVATSVGFNIIFLVLSGIMYEKGIFDLFIWPILFVGLYTVAMTAASINVYKELHQ